MLIQLLSNFPPVFDLILDMLNVLELSNLEKTCVQMAEYVKPVEIYKKRLTFVMSRYHEIFKKIDQKDQSNHENFWVFRESESEKQKCSAIINQIREESKDPYLQIFIDLYLKHYPIERIRFRNNYLNPKFLFHLSFEPWSYCDVSYDEKSQTYKYRSDEFEDEYVVESQHFSLILTFILTDYLVFGQTLCIQDPNLYNTLKYRGL